LWNGVIPLNPVQGFGKYGAAAVFEQSASYNKKNKGKTKC